MLTVCIVTGFGFKVREHGHEGRWGGGNRKKSYQGHLPGTVAAKDVTRENALPAPHVLLRLLVICPSFHPLDPTHEKLCKLFKSETGRKTREGVGKKVGPEHPTSPQCSG